MSNRLSETVPAALRAELARRGVAKGVFAHSLGRGEMWLYRRLNGRVEFTLSDLDAICDELAIQPAELLAAAAAATPAPKKATAGGVSRRRSSQPPSPSGERNGR